MEFRLLGPEEVLCGEQVVPISAAKHRAVLSMLLLRSDRVVSTEDLIDGLWGTDPPRTARTTLHNYIRRLRGVLREQGADLLHTRPGGYTVDLAAHRLDVHDFEELAQRAEGARAAGDLDTASTLWRRALRLWRGRALEGTVSRYLADVEAPRLDEARRSAFESLVDTDLQLGRHHALLGDIRRELEREPLRERLRAQYMLALYRANRRADALDVYREGRRVLIQELGLEPGPQLRQMERAVLTDSLALRPPTVTVSDAPTATNHPGRTAQDRADPPPVPRQLPAPPQHFTGRHDELRMLDEWADDQGAGTSTVVTAIDGRGGVGKTALALRWGHAARARFPDGQLYIDLRGYSTCRPVTPLEALTAFLHALAVPCDSIPGRLDRATGLYRTLVAGKRILIVLDNARTVDQVRALLPGTPGSNVVVTSRDTLAGLVVRDNARHLTVGALSPAEAEKMLTRLMGAALVDAEPEATTELARLCGHVPLALGVAAVNVREGGGDRPVADYVTRLRARDRRLCVLSMPEDATSDPQAVFALSYLSLTPEARMLYRRLSLVPGPTTTTEAASALLGLERAQTAQVLRRLVAAHLIAQQDYDVFRLHDLLRLHAEDRMAEDESAEVRSAALQRLYGYYLTGVHDAARLLYPEKLRAFTPQHVADDATAVRDQTAALQWFQREHTNLVLAVQQAVELGLRSAAWELCDALHGYFWLVRTAPDWIAVAEAAHKAARAAGEVRGSAAAWLSLGDAQRGLGRYENAARHYGAALRDAESAGWLEGKAQALINLGRVDVLTGCLRDAVQRHKEALAVLPDGPQCAMLRLGAEAGMGALHQELGDLRTAERHIRTTVELSRRIDSRGAWGVSQGSLGQVLNLLGHSDEALDRLTDALAVHREIGDRGAEAETLRALADWHLDHDDLAVALDLAVAAASLADSIGGTALFSAALRSLARVHARRGEQADAVAVYDRAHAHAELAAARHTLATILLGRAELHLMSGRLADAADQARAALTRARAEGYHVIEGQALTALARTELARGRPDEAAALAAQAAAVLAETGHRRGLAEAHELLSRAPRQADRGAGAGGPPERTPVPGSPG
ncbi:AfsR/SARP family transcriptional regulator [Streptomyces melanogenes]|uniref:AfsR/SARP family transcriptional regulator n=1 Tax=Streptomyces melanogenes TaxID=67326 RepID=UPI0037B91522